MIKKLAGLIFLSLLINPLSSAMEASTSESLFDSSKDDTETTLADCSNKELLDYLYLTPEKADLLKSSYQILLDNGKKTMGYWDELISKFYTKLYAESPAIHGVFAKGVHRNINQSKLVALAVKNIAAVAADKEKLKEFVKYLKEDLGPKHYHVLKFNKIIDKSHFIIFAKILAETLAEEYIEQGKKGNELNKSKLKIALEKNRVQICAVLEVFFPVSTSSKTVFNNDNWYRLFIKNLGDAVCDSQEEEYLKDKKRSIENAWYEILEKVGSVIFDVAKKGNSIATFVAANNEKWIIFQGGIVIAKSGISSKENKLLAVENLSLLSGVDENSLNLVFTKHKKNRSYVFKGKNFQQKKELEDIIERIISAYEQMSSYISNKKI